MASESNRGTSRDSLLSTFEAMLVFSEEERVFVALSSGSENDSAL